jgi:hypothetical protein
MNPQGNKTDKPTISPIQYIAINNTPQARKFIVDFGKTPATSMPDLQLKMAAIVKQFGDQAKKELAKLHPDTAWIVKAMAGANKMEGGITDNEFIAAHGNGCMCPRCAGHKHRHGCDCPRCAGLEKHSNFITNFRSDADLSTGSTLLDTNAADGSAAEKAAEISTPAEKVKTGISTGAVLLAVFALGVLIIASGERQRSFN